MYSKCEPWLQNTLNSHEYNVWLLYMGQECNPLQTEAANEGLQDH